MGVATRKSKEKAPGVPARARSIAAMSIRGAPPPGPDVVVTSTLERIEVTATDYLPLTVHSQKFQNGPVWPEKYVSIPLTRVATPVMPGDWNSGRP